MSNNVTHSFTVDQSPEEVFDAINDVRGWWSEEIKGDTANLNAEFGYHFEDIHRCNMKIIESVPGKKVVWLVLENYFNFTNDKSEWTGDHIVFSISRKEGKTELQFTQIGLTPEYECYEICKDAWGNYIKNSLKSLIETGKGQPNATGKPRTANEKRLSSDN
jgi:uncharacterized protein YndB with AHSA1/START domain